jgi:hypothetical protein
MRHGTGFTEAHKRVRGGLVGKAIGPLRWRPPMVLSLPPHAERFAGVLPCPLDAWLHRAGSQNRGGGLGGRSLGREREADNRALLFLKRTFCFAYKSRLLNIGRIPVLFENSDKFLHRFIRHYWPSRSLLCRFSNRVYFKRLKEKIYGSRSKT